MNLSRLVSPVAHAIEVKHSRFLAHAAPVTSAEDAMAWLQVMRDADATHNCWAWRIGGDYRSSDDGEPAGSAGRPILSAIDAQGFDQTVVVVIRWYGGIKLGVGGLVRAYGGAAAECLRTAPRVTIVEKLDIDLAFPFADTGVVHGLLAQAGAEKLQEGFGTQGPQLRIRLPADALDGLKQRLRDATRNRARFSDET